MSCQLDTIDDCIAEEDVREALAELPQELYDTYKRVLRKIKGPTAIRLAKLAIVWLVTAKRPLQLAQVVEAIGFNERSTSNPRKRAIIDDILLVKICSSLVSYNPSTGEIALSHFSVKVRLTTIECTLHLAPCTLKDTTQQNKLANTWTLCRQLKGIFSFTETQRVQPKGFFSMHIRS